MIFGQALLGNHCWTKDHCWNKGYSISADLLCFFVSLFLCFFVSLFLQQERVVHRLLAVWTESKVVSSWLTWEEVKRRRVHEQQR